MKFILTNELGRLAKWLRILGFDAVYCVDRNHSELIINSLREERIILTRDSRIGPISGIRLLRIRYDNVKDQLAQVLKELDIALKDAKLFSRCVICNLELEDIPKQDIKNKVPDYVYNTHTDFVICPKCRRAYWQGTHWGNVRKLLDEISI